MTWLLILGALQLAGLIVVADHLLRQHVLPSKRDAVFGELANVPRRHLESLSSWAARSDKALCISIDAEHAFFDAATVQGRTRPNGRGGLVSDLPVNSREAIVCLHAKYPDGPPLEKLLAIAGLQ